MIANNNVTSLYTKSEYNLFIHVYKFIMNGLQLAASSSIYL